MGAPFDWETDRGYRPIADYALIGDAHTAALVARDGSIDWLCWPHFDGSAVFCRLLDAQRGGWFRVGPAESHVVTRAHNGDTNVLVTTFHAGGGAVRLTDFMPVRKQQANGEIAPSRQVLRLVEGLAGELAMAVEFWPTFDYARAETTLTIHPNGAVAHGNGETLTLGCPVELQRDASGALLGRHRVATGDRFWVTLSYQAATEAASASRDSAADAALVETLAFWSEWSSACTYTGPYHQFVRRSALTLKLLTFAPTGAVIAAPTTSLPEVLGGVRNWDYRYTWLRDAAFMLSALQEIGYHREASGFLGWIEEICMRGDHDLQIMYRIDGSPDLAEQTLDDLEGYRQSQPVRIGNAAASQRQLDVYGEVLNAASLHVEYLGSSRAGIWSALWRLADQAAARWREPDAGIWEVRGGPQHFLYSKLLCWVALDRAVRLAERTGLADGRPARWRRTRRAIRRLILTQGYDYEVGAFTQALGSTALDASALALPLLGFLPATDPRVRATVARIQERLTSDGLVYRYLAADGLPDGEATFTLCSFWLVDNLAVAGRVDEARELFERVTGYANDVGLLAEEIDPATGELLGNFPQAFSHLALIRSARNIALAEGGFQQRRTDHNTSSAP